MNHFAAVLRTEMRLTMRDFFTVVFALIFPSLMLLIFGNMFGSYPGQTGETMLDDMTPAYCCMIIGVTGLMGFPLTLVSNLERGVYRRFDASPAGKTLIIWGELAANLILTCIGLIILLLFAWLAFGIAARGSWAAVAGAVLLSAAALFGLGFLLVAAAPSPRAALALCYIVYFVMLFLSGATLPVMLFSKTLLIVSDWLPMTYAVRLMQDAFNGASTEAGFSVTVLTGVGLGSALVGNFLLRRKS